MKITHEYAQLDLSSLSTERLFSLNAEIMKELQSRVISTVHVQKKEHVVVVSPSDFEHTFIRNCLREDYVHAEMKDRYRDLAKEYPDFFKRNGYPTDLRGSSLNRWKKYHTKKE